MSMKTPAEVIIDRCAELGISYANLSRRVGRNHSYIHTFISQGSPEVLPEDVRRKIAMILQVGEALLRPTINGSPVDLIEVTIKNEDMRPAFNIGDVVFAVAGQPPQPREFVVLDGRNGETDVWTVNSVDMDGAELIKLANKSKKIRWTPELGELYRVRQTNYG